MRAMFAAAAPLLRRRWVPLVALGLLVGLGSGIALAAGAGGRRTDTAMGRFVAHTGAGT